MSSIRSRMRSVVVAVVSAVVLAGAIFYVVAPSGVSTQLSVAEVSGPQPYSVDITPQYQLASASYSYEPDSAARKPKSKHKPKPKPKETIYGVIQVKSVPVRSVYIRLSGAERKTRGQSALLHVKYLNKAFRSSVRLTPGKYRITVTLKVRNRGRTLSTTKTLKNLHFYRIKVTVQASGIVSFFPVSTY